MRKINVALIAILLLSLFLKLLCRYWEPTVSRDGCLYIRLAQIWYDTGSFQGVIAAWPGMWLPPLPLYLMKCLMTLGLSAETAGVSLNLFAGTFTPLIVYGIAWEILQRRDIAICATLLAAVHPTLNALSIEVQRDMIYLFFAGNALWMLAAGIRRAQWQYWLAAGLFCGCAMLSRFETLEFLIIVPVALMILGIGKYIHWKLLSSYGSLFGAGFFGIVLVLSFLMQTQDYLFPNYERYYQGKWDFSRTQFLSESKK